MENQKKRTGKKKKTLQSRLITLTGTKSGGQVAHRGAPFSPGCFYQPGPLVPAPGTGTKGGTFSLETLALVP